VPGGAVRVVLGGAGAAALAVTVVYDGVVDPWPLDRGDNLVWGLGVLVPWYAAGLVAALQDPGHPVARRLLVVGSLFPVQAVLGHRLAEAHARGGEDWFWVLNAALQAVVLAMVLAFFEALLLFPGNGARRRGRVMPVLRVALLTVPFLLVACSDTLLVRVPVLEDVGELANPVAVIDVPGLHAVLAAVYDASNLLVLGALVSLVRRFRHASDEARQRMKWLVLPGLAAAGLGLLDLLLTASGVDLDTSRVAPVEVVVLGLVPVALGLALLRHRLLDVDWVLRRSMVYGAAWFGIGAAYLAAASLLGLAASERLPVGLAVVATAASTMAIQPLRRRLDGLAQRRILGERPAAPVLLLHLGETLEEAFDVSQLAPQVASTVRDGLGVSWVYVVVGEPAGDGRVPAEALVGTRGPGEEPALEVPIGRAGDVAGTIQCGPRPERRLDDVDGQVLAAFARQVALAVRNAQLARDLAGRLSELAASRARVVQAQDAERRRIERDIHDGVQQRVVAVGTRLRLARNELTRDAGRADRELADLQEEVLATLHEIRELVRGIYPPVLVDRGLLEAVESRVSDIPITVVVEADPRLCGARFRGEVEAAAYFVVTEALTNVCKHAATGEALVRLRCAGQSLAVDVEDRGVGFCPANVPQSGLLGLRDRVETCGGRLSVASGAGRGTRVSAHFPAAVPSA
jgi:signal transduction histidine kinase